MNVPEPMYRCGECNRAVVVLPEGEAIRACDHHEAKIIANVSAVLYGISALRNMTQQEREARGL